MGGNFDGYWLFKYLTRVKFDRWSVSFTTHCNDYFANKNIDGLNFDGLLETVRNIKINFLLIKILCYIASIIKDDPKIKGFIPLK